MGSLQVYHFVKKGSEREDMLSLSFPKEFGTLIDDESAVNFYLKNWNIKFIINF